MPFLIILLILFVLLVVGIWITMSLFGLLITLVVAGFIGWIADMIVPGKIPYGWLGAIVAGLAGSWIGTMIFDFGPAVAGITLIPALAGAIILAFIAELIGGSSSRARRL